MGDKWTRDNRKEKAISQQELKAIFSYNENTGALVWLMNRGTRKVKGLEAGWIVIPQRGRTKYIDIRVNGFAYKAHRLAWLYVHGEWPLIIDHIDGDGTNNRMSNLRNVTESENTRNRPLQLNNSSGHSGVYLCKPSGKWYAIIGVKGKKVSLGHFDLIDDAIKARKEAEKKYGYHPNHGMIKQ